jgi:hypothetical protein
MAAQPNIRLWPPEALGKDWQPPACTGWPKGAALVVALAGNLTGPQNGDDLLARLGRISALTTVRYWSVTTKRWTPLFVRTIALAKRDATATRADFSPDEIRSGREFYFLSSDNRSTGATITHAAVKELDSTHIVLEMVNVSPIRWFGLTLVPPGGMRTLYFLDRQADSAWHFYSLSRIETSSLLSRFIPRASYINRAAAMYRYAAQIPTDGEPPAAP